MAKTKEEIETYEENICAICHSIYCQKKIRIKHDGNVTIIRCKEYNKKNGNIGE